MTWKIEIEAGTPEEAAQQARVAQLNPGSSATVFQVWEYAEEKMHRIDVEEPVDKLDRSELIAIRASLRWLQCSKHSQGNQKELASAMLIFLDREESIGKR